MSETEVENPFQKLAEMAPETGHLMAQIIQASYDGYANTSGALIESLMRQVKELQCEREIVLERVEELANRPYVPHPDAFRAALFVDRVEIQRRMEGSDVG